MLEREKMILMAQRSRQNYMEKMCPLLAVQPPEGVVLLLLSGAATLLREQRACAYIVIHGCA